MFPWREALLDVAFVRDPDVVPQGFMVPAEGSISCKAAQGGDIELDVAPDPDVDVRKRLRVEEPDEVDDEKIGAGEWLRRTQCTGGPVVATEAAGPTPTQRLQHVCDQPVPVDPVPVRGALMRAGWIEEVIAAQSHRTGERAHQVAGQC